MKQKIKISILVPIYGTELYIKRCAMSLFEQTYENIEYIFINDCTKDNSIDILKDTIKMYPTREPYIKIINHKFNEGLAGARLTGLINSTGDYIWCVDSDDYVKVNAIETCLPYMEQGHDLIVFNYIEKTKSGLSKHSMPPLTIEHVLDHYISPSIWKYIVHRSLYFNYKILPVKGINHSEDYLLTARLILVSQKNIYLENEYLYFYENSNPNSYTNNINIKSLENEADSIEIVRDFCAKLNKEKKYKNELAISFSYTYILLRKVDKKNPRLLNLRKQIYRLNKILYLFMYVCRSPYLCNKTINGYRKFIFKRKS